MAGTTRYRALPFVICHSVCPCWRRIICPAIGLLGRLRAIPVCGCILVLTHNYDCRLIFEPILVHWPVRTQIGFFACMSVDYANKKYVKPDENWFKVIAKAICKPTVQVSNFTHIQGTADRAAEDEEEAD